MKSATTKRRPPVAGNLVQWIEAGIDDEIILGRIERHYFDAFSVQATRAFGHETDLQASYYYDILSCKELIEKRGAPPKALELLSEFGRRHHDRINAEPA